MSLGTNNNNNINESEEEEEERLLEDVSHLRDVRKRSRSGEDESMSEDSTWRRRHQHGGGGTSEDEENASSDQSSSSGPPPKVARRGSGASASGRQQSGPASTKREEDDDESAEEELDMYWACRKGRVKRIEQLVEAAGEQAKAAVNDSVHPRGSTPVLVASYFDQPEAVACLLEKGADPAPRLSNQTALHLAAHRGACLAARVLLDAKDTPFTIDVDVTNDEEETSLFVAAYADQADMVKLLVDAGADVERPSGTNGQRPLHIAGELGSVACLNYLLSKGAQVDAVDASGETALYKATEADRLGSVIVLLRHGADASARVLEHGRFPLFAACERGRDLDIVAALAGNSSDLDQPTDNGYTSLYVAARYNLADVVRLLLAQGADPNFENKYGETPLFAACRENHDAVVKVLLKHKDTKINCSSSRWGLGTPLHVAASLDHREISKRLLRHNADLRSVARDPASLLHVVCSNGFLGGFTLNYADIDLCDSDGLAPLALALENNHIHLARILFVDYDAQPPMNCDDLPPDDDDDDDDDVQLPVPRQRGAGGQSREDPPDHPILELTNDHSKKKRARLKLFNRIVRHWRRRLKSRRAAQEADEPAQENSERPQSQQQQQQQQLQRRQQQQQQQRQHEPPQPETGGENNGNAFMRDVDQLQSDEDDDEDDAENDAQPQNNDDDDVREHISQEADNGQDEESA